MLAKTKLPRYPILPRVRVSRGNTAHRKGRPMDYSRCLMALVASRIEELQSQVDQSLQPHLQRITELVTSFFGRASLADRGLGV